MTLRGASCVMLLASACGSKAPAPKEHAVAMRAMKFDPAVVHVHVGDTIVWTNEDIVPHTVSAIGTLDSPQIASKQQWRFTVMTPGDITYKCTLHPTMFGTISAK